MEKIPTNPTCGDTEQEAGECGTHGWARAWTPHPRDTTHCGGKEREREKKNRGKGKRKRGKRKRGTKNQLGVATLSSGEG